MTKTLTIPEYTADWPTCWENFIKSLTKSEERIVAPDVIVTKLKEYNATVEFANTWTDQGRHTLRSVIYVTFNADKDLTFFLLRWS